MTTEKPILKLPRKAEALRMQILRDKWLDLVEEITDGAIEVAKQGKHAKEHVEAIKILYEMTAEKGKKLE